MTSVHPRCDTRVFHKMCSSLASKGYDTSLVVADTLKNEKKNNVSIISTGQKENSRLKRMLYDTQRVYKKALDLDGHLYHIHDPELIPAGLKLKKNGKKVIFDAHEDLPQQILSKSHLSPLFKKAVSNFFEYFEQINFKKFDAIIAATPFISNKIKQTNPNTENINNYPLLTEFKDLKNIDWSHKKQEIAYVGGVSKIVKSLNFSKDIRLNLAGSFSEQKFKEELKNENGWQKVNELGWLDRQNVIATLKKSQLGINSRLDTIQAAILIENLAGFEVELEKRNQVALNCHKAQEGQFITPYIKEGYYSSWAQYTILCKNRLKAQKNFEDKKTPTAVYYSKCMHEQTAFKYLEYKKGDFPIAEDLSNKVLSLPMSPYML